MITMQLSEVHHIMSNTEEIHELTFELKQRLLIDTETDSKHTHQIENRIKNVNFIESKVLATQVNIQLGYLSGQVHWNVWPLSSEFYENCQLAKSTGTLGQHNRSE